MWLPGPCSSHYMYYIVAWCNTWNMSRSSTYNNKYSSPQSVHYYDYIVIALETFSDLIG